MDKLRRVKLVVEVEYTPEKVTLEIIENVIRKHIDTSEWDTRRINLLGVKADYWSVTRQCEECNAHIHISPGGFESADTHDINCTHFVSELTGLGF